MMVGKLLSFWDGIFSGAMLNFQGIQTYINLSLGAWNLRRQMASSR